MILILLLVVVLVLSLTLGRLAGMPASEIAGLFLTMSGAAVVFYGLVSLL
ncbi:MAG: hypothetical protein ACE5HQ_02360 [Gemmatimonadota bacterium]